MGLGGGVQSQTQTFTCAESHQTEVTDDGRACVCFSALIGINLESQV